MAATNLFSGHHLDMGLKSMAALIGLAALLYVCAGAGMAYVAGFDEVEHRLITARWWWLGPSFGAVIVGLIGYRRRHDRGWPGPRRVGRPLRP